MASGLLNPQRRRALVQGLLDTTQAASNSAASTVAAPVDALAWALRKAGAPIPQAPFGGSDWMKAQGLMRDVQSPVANVVGESIGNVLPIVAAAKAPQIASGLLKMGENAAARTPINAATGKQAGAIVWHGSPHKFDRFDASKIGTGEGAQAYGHGLYLAESPDVATSYKNLVQRDPSRLAVDGKPVSPDTMYGRAAEDVARIGLKAAIQKIDDNIRFNEKYAPDIAALYKDVRAQISALDPARVNLKEGSLYKVDLPDDAIARMLDWDKPLSQQADNVRGTIENLSGVRAYKSRIAAFDEALLNALQGGNTSLPKQPIDPLGADLYSRVIGGGNSVAAQKLRNAGIPGIRYLDGGSRGTGSGTSNFVVFPGNEGLLNILERNGQPLR